MEYIAKILQLCVFRKYFATYLIFYNLHAVQIRLSYYSIKVA